MVFSLSSLNKRLVSSKDLERMATETAYKTIIDVFASIRYELKDAMQLTPQIDTLLNEMEKSYLAHAPEDLKKKAPPRSPKEK